MYRDKYKVKYLSRKVVLAWKRALDSQMISWREIFPIICALYELDDNFQKDESFQNLNIDSLPFYIQFQEILNEFNLANNDNIHEFRRLTKKLLKTYLEVNKELHKLQDQAMKKPDGHNKIVLKDHKGKEKSFGTLTSPISCPTIPMIKIDKKVNYSMNRNSINCDIREDELIIPNVIIEELINFYIELKKADNNVKKSSKPKDDEKTDSVNKSYITSKDNNTKDESKESNGNSVNIKENNKNNGLNDDRNTICNEIKTDKGLNVCQTHIRRRSYSTNDIPLKIRTDLSEGKHSKPILTPRRNNIPPVTFTRSPSCSLGCNKDININDYKTSPVLSPRVSTPNSAATISSNDILTTNHMFSPIKTISPINPLTPVNNISSINPVATRNISPVSPINSMNSMNPVNPTNSINSVNSVNGSSIIKKNSISTNSGSTTTPKRSKMSKLKKIKKVGLKVATNIGIRNKESHHCRREEFNSGDNLSTLSINSQNSSRFDDSLVMSSLSQDSSFSGFSVLEEGPFSASAVVPSSTISNPKMAPLPLRKTSLSIAKLAHSNSMNYHINHSQSVNGGRTYSNRFEDYLYSSVNGSNGNSFSSSPSVASSSSQTLVGSTPSSISSPFFNSPINNSPLYSQSQFQSQSQSQSQSPSQTMTLYGSSPLTSSIVSGSEINTSNIFDKDNIYRFKDINTINKFNSNGKTQLYSQNTIPFSSQTISQNQNQSQSQGLSQSSSIKRFNPNGFTPYDDPLPVPPRGDNSNNKSFISKHKFNPYEEPLPPSPYGPLGRMGSVNSVHQEELTNNSQPFALFHSQSQSQSQSQNQSQNHSQFQGQAQVQPEFDEDELKVNAIFNKYTTHKIPMGVSNPIYKTSFSPKERLPSNVIIKNNTNLVKVVNGRDRITSFTADIIDDTSISEITGMEEEIDDEVVQGFAEQLQKDEKELQEVVVNHKKTSLLDPFEEKDPIPENDHQENEDDGESDDSSSEIDGHKNSILITDFSVIDSLESDLLSHKVQQRKSISNTNTKNEKSEFILTSIDEEDEGESSDDTVVDKENEEEKEKKEETAISWDHDEKENSFSEDEEREKELEKEDLFAIKNDLSKKRKQFRLSFLTSKSSDISLRNKSGKQSKEDSIMEKSSPENSEDEYELDYDSEFDSNEKVIVTNNIEKISKIVNESKQNEGEDDDDDENCITPTQKSISFFSNSKEKKYLLSNRSNVFKVLNERNIKDNESEKSVTFANPPLYFLHPIQLFNIIQMIYVYTVAKIPNRAQGITQRWMAATNDIALEFWNILKIKEDIISSIIIYSTFYDHIKMKAFPLNDPKHLFLKELLSTLNSDSEKEDEDENENEIKKKNNNIKNESNSHSDSEIFKNDIKSFENEITNKKLIMEIKKELLI